MDRRFFAAVSTLSNAGNLLYDYNMKQPYETTRIWVKTLKKLRLIAAYTGETIVTVLERLAADELKRVTDLEDK